MKIVLLIAAVSLICAAVFLGLWIAKESRHMQEMQSGYQPNPANENSIEVIGWRDDELDKILGDFRGMYGLPAVDFVVTRYRDGHFRVSFPNDVEPKNLYFLVNYIRYPKDLDFRARRIGVLGRARLNQAFGIPDSSLSGMRAKLYVPAGDSEFDNVYVQPESGKAFKIPFTRLIWEIVDDPRVPDEIFGAQKG